MSVDVGAYNPYAPPNIPIEQQQPGSAPPPPNVMSLPPIQHFDPPAPNMQSQQSQPRHYNPATAATLSNGAPQHPPPYPPPEYQYQTVVVPNQQQQQQQHSVSSNSQQVQLEAANGQSNGGAMRYPIQPQTPSERQVSGGRHKKEIKRRTKTGCLTCRKRRIKCDEGHPTCRNCQKSKRECLGYDPIFKPTPIQPANIQPLPPHNPQQHQQHQQLHSQPHQQQQNQHQHQQHQQHQLQPQQRLAQQQQQQQQQYHQHVPPHEGGPVVSSLPTNPYQTPPYPPPGAAFTPAQQPRGPDSGYGYNSPLDPELGPRSPQISRMAQNNNHPGTALQQQRNVKQLRIDDLFAINDIPPRFQLRDPPPSITPTTQDQIGQFYKFNYAQGLDRLFETTWYSGRGLAYLNYNPMLQDFTAQVIEQMSAREDIDTASIMSLEARLVWHLAILPRHAATYANNDPGGDPQLVELLPRVDTLECLLTGQFLDPNKICPTPQAQTPSSTQDASSSSNQKFNERSFWHHLSKFVSFRGGDDHPSGSQGVNESLAVIRNILAMLENRDVLYSIAIARHIGGRLPTTRHLSSATNNDVEDEINKLKVAERFVENEELRGTSQVIQRVCSMGIRGWKLVKQ